MGFVEQYQHWPAFALWDMLMTELLEVPMSTHVFWSRALTCGAVAALSVSFVTFSSRGAVSAEATPSVQQIIEALKPRKTRGLSVKPSKAEIEKAQVIDDLKTKAASRGLSVPERQQLAEAVSDKPSLDFVIYFDFNSANISSKSKASLDALGTALKDDSLKDASIMVAGHTDAKGSDAYNMKLSERRAKAVEAYLVQKYQIPVSRIHAVGKGEAEPLTANPFDQSNRRVQFARAN